MTEAQKNLSEILASAAKECIKNGVSVFPLGEAKEPLFGYMWGKHRREKMTAQEIDNHFQKAGGLGVIGGAASGGLEIIDVDVKDDITGTIWTDYSTMLQDNIPELYPKLVIARSKNNGRHIYFRCSDIGRNDSKIARNADNKVLIETRAEGGYAAAAPTPGYTFTQGDLSNIPTITPEERSIIFGVAGSFNLYKEPAKQERQPASGKVYQSAGLGPFDAYSESGDVIKLLVDNGWTEGTQSGQRTFLKRPGDTDAKSSGNFHYEKRVFFVHSTNAAPLENRGYGPTELFILLECSGDKKIAYRRLLELGYGEPYQGETAAPTQVKIESIKVSSVNSVTKEIKVISETGKTLKIEEIRINQGTDIVIISPGVQSTAEVLAALQLAAEAGKRIYVKEGAEPEIRSYQYQLQAVLNQYGAIQEATGGFTDRQADELTEALITISSGLKNGIDQQRYNEMVLGLDAIKNLGITEATLKDAADRIASNKAKEVQAASIKKLHDQATALIDKGDTAGYLDLVAGSAETIRQQQPATELSQITRAGLTDRLVNNPPSIRSGYSVGNGHKKQEILLPAGALSFIVGPSGHGKTRFLLNMANNVVLGYPEKEVYFFSYEEAADPILIKAFNIYQNSLIGANNLETLENYFKGHTKELRPTDLAHLESKDKQFFADFIESNRLNIHATDMNVTALSDTIRQLHKEGKASAVFIDYIQLMRLEPGKFKTNSRQEEAKEICQILNTLAKGTGLPIVLGAQFNREVSKQTDVHYNKIGEAGDIERIASLIVGIFDNAVATDPSGSPDYYKQIGAVQGPTIYTKILKNRIGPSGMTGNIPYNGSTGKMDAGPIVPFF